MFEEQLSYKSAPEKFSEDTENGGNNPKLDIWENFQQNCLIVELSELQCCQKVGISIFFVLTITPPPRKMQLLVFEKGPRW